LGSSVVIVVGNARGRGRRCGGLARCGSCGLMLEICHQHGCSFKVDHTIAACLKLFQGGWIDGDVGLGRSGRGRGGLLNPGVTIPTTSAPFSHQGDPTIFGVNSTVMTEKEIATDESTAAFHALEGSFFCVRTLMSAAMFTSAECAIAKLALVFLLWSGGLFRRRVGCRSSVGCHFDSGKYQLSREL
jgi:hypothetical protein